MMIIEAVENDIRIKKYTLIGVLKYIRRASINRSLSKFLYKINI
jgi:hypothetical protein